MDRCRRFPVKHLRALAAGGAAALSLAPRAGLAQAAGIDAFASEGIVWGAFFLTLAFAALSLAVLVRVWRDGRRRPTVDDIHGETLDALTTPFAIVGPGYRAIYANGAFHAMFGEAGTSILHLLDDQSAGEEESGERLRRLLSQASAGQSGRTEIRLRRPSGRLEWRSVSAYPIPDRPGYLLVGVEDITSRREMEQIILEEQQKLFDFLENAPVGFYSADASGKFIYVNHTFANWLATTPDEMIGTEARLADFVATPLPEDAPPYDPFGGTGREQRGEVTLRGRDGRTFQAYVSQSIVEGEKAGTLRTRTVVRDLTPEREWREALQISEQRFQRFFNDAPVGIALLDPEGRVTECNRAFRAMAGDRGEAVVGGLLADLVIEEDRAETAGCLARVLEGGERGETRLEARLAGPRERTAAFFVNRIEDSDGRVTGLIVHALDMTEQKNLEVQFAQSQKLQAAGQLAGGIAHDFNNLLTAMIGFCDLLLLRHRPGEQSFADIMQIKQNANRAANLVRQLLAFSRQQTLQPRVLNVTDVLAELNHLLHRLIGERIELKVVHGRDLGYVRVDQGQLEQVIINLAVNARDAMPDGGTLTLRTSNVETTAPKDDGPEPMPPGRYVLIEVIDTGIGIPKENLDRIFEPFFSTKEVGSGTGLGLSTVYGIVKQTGGYVFVDSRPGEGARFSIYLPQFDREEAAAAASGTGEEGAARDLTGAGTVLLVEDEDAVRMFSARALRNKGYHVLEATSGEAALDLLEGLETPIDLLITDVVMPRMDGPNLIRKLRGAQPDVKVICISGYAEESFRRQLDADVDVHFLPKPYSLNQLAGKVKDVMGEARP